VLTLVAGCSLLVPAYVGLLLTGGPTLLCPLPLLTVIPAFMLSSLSGARWTWAVVVSSLLFFAWNPGLFRRQAQVPKRTLVLLAAMPVLTAGYFVGNWKYGLDYQGRQYVYAICAINGIWLVVLWMIVAGRSHRISFRGNLLLHWLLFAWLGWYAFPYLGELP
jgi:hypothetical protein